MKRRHFMATAAAAAVMTTSGGAAVAGLAPLNPVDELLSNIGRSFVEETNPIKKLRLQNASDVVCWLTEGLEFRTWDEFTDYFVGYVKAATAFKAEIGRYESYWAHVERFRKSFGQFFGVTVAHNIVQGDMELGLIRRGNRSSSWSHETSLTIATIVNHMPAGLMSFQVDELEDPYFVVSARAVARLPEAQVRAMHRSQF